MLDINGNIKLSKVNLSGDDYKVLTQMYLPLINSDSLALYLALNNLNKDEVSVRFILDLFSINNLTILVRSLNKLEGIGLVKEFSKDSNTIIHLIRPLAPKSFLNNHFLKPYLINKIGEVEYDLYREYYFKEPSYRGYTNVTKAFDEVYKRTKGDSTYLPIDFEEEDNIKIRNANFDYYYFKMLFNNELSKDVLNDSDFEKNIIKISYQYELNEQEMFEAVTKSIHGSKDISYELISEYAGHIYQNKVPSGKVNFVSRDVVVKTEDFNEEDLRAIEFCKNNSIASVLAFVTGDKGSLADVRDFNKLQDQTGLSIGVINVLILYLTSVKKSDNLSYTYIEKVARNWMKAGVKTAEDAFYLIKEKHEKENKKGREVEEPSWLKDDYKKEESTLSDDEVKKAMEIKKQLFGDNNE